MINFASNLTQTLRRRGAKIFAIMAVLAVILCSTGLYAQSGAGSIQGTVTDSTGAVIPEAKIHVLNNATGSAADSITNGVGFYRVRPYPAGTGTAAHTQQL